MKNESLIAEASRFLAEIKSSSKELLAIIKPLVDESNAGSERLQNDSRSAGFNFEYDPLSVIKFSIGITLAYRMDVNGNEVVESNNHKYRLLVFTFGKKTTCSNGAIDLAVEKYIRENINLSLYPNLEL